MLDTTFNFVLGAMQKFTEHELSTSLLIKRVGKKFPVFFIILATVTVANSVLNPYFFGVIGGKFIPSLVKGLDIARKVVIDQGILLIALLLIGIVDRVCRYIYEPSINQLVAEDLLNHTIHQDGSYFNQHNSGTISSALTSLSGGISGLIGLTPVLIQQAFSMVMGIVLIFYKGGYTQGLIFFSIVAFFTTMAWVVFAPWMGKYTQLSTAKSLELSGSLSNVIENIHHVQSFSTQRYEFANFKKKIWEIKLINRKSEVAQGLFVLFTFGLMTWGVTFLSTLLCYFFFKKEWTDLESIGQFASLLGHSMSGVMFSVMLIRPLVSVISQIKAAIAVLGQKRRVYEKDIQVQILTKAVLKGDIQIENFTFTYPNTQPVFKDFSLRIKEGEKVGLVGRSGGGKTTLIHALMGHFQDCYSGKIIIGTHDIRDLNTNLLRSNFSYMPQRVTLFSRTIRDNIAYGSDWATQEEIEQAAMQAFAHEFIQELPNGYQTVVGVGASSLSGGQQQRILLARALLKSKKSCVFVADEGTSALDNESEELVSKALRNIMKMQTSVMIAHRLSTLKRLVDRIIVLQDGKLAEEGSHEELLRKDKGVYRSLWESQFLTQ